MPCNWFIQLQGIDYSKPLFVSLNPKRDIPEHLVFDRHDFDHPVFDHAAIAAQDHVQAMQGSRNTWFCGAHLGHGFHEDGLQSAVRVARLLGAQIPWTIRQFADSPASAAPSGWLTPQPETA